MHALESTASAVLSGKRLSIRPFGETSDDLELEFDVPRPFVTTQLIHQCVVDSDGTPLDLKEVWSLSLSQRLQLVLSIGLRTLPSVLGVSVNCPACDDLLGLNVDLAAFQGSEDISSIRCHPESNVDIILRLPTGDDQCKWLEEEREWNASVWSAQAAASLVVNHDGRQPEPGWVVPETWVPAIAEALEQADPLTAATLETTCCGCQHDFSVIFDVEEHVISRIRGLQPRLLDEVHRLATAYHWTETEIFNVPTKRRRKYLELIDRNHA